MECQKLAPRSTSRGISESKIKYTQGLKFNSKQTPRGRKEKHELPIGGVPPRLKNRDLWPSGVKAVLSNLAMRTAPELGSLWGGVLLMTNTHFITISMNLVLETNKTKVKLLNSSPSVRGHHQQKHLKTSHRVTLSPGHSSSQRQVTLSKLLPTLPSAVALPFRRRSRLLVFDRNDLRAPRKREPWLAEL